MSTTRSSTPLTRDRILTAADELFAADSLMGVSLARVADQAGLSLSQVDDEFDSKNALVETILDNRHSDWIDRLTLALTAYPAPEDKLLAIFTFLEHWFAEETFHRCAFTTSYGELGPSVGWVDLMVRRHKDVFDTLVADLALQSHLPQTVASSIALLANGAQVTAAATGSIAAARDARSTAAVLLAMYRTEPHDLLFA